MPALASMKTLTHEIVQAHRSRMEATGHLKATVGSLLRDLHSTHRSASMTVNSTLKKGRAARRADVHRTLKGYESRRKAMSATLHSGLAQTKSACEADVQAMLTGLRASNLDTCRTLRHVLARSAADCRALVEGTLHECGQARRTAGKSLHVHLTHGHMDRRATVQGLLAGMGQSRRSISRSLHAGLARNSAVLRSSTTAVLKDFDQQQAVLRTELAAIRGQWQSMVGKVNAARRRSASETTVSPKPATSQHVPAAAPTAKEAAEEPPELNALHDRVFEFLADHPGGSRLVEMEAELKASRFQMSRVLRNLMDENKIEKRDLLYFAI